MSPQIADIFNDPLSRNTALNITLHDTQATDASDFNKLYSSILQQLNDTFGWAPFQPNDYVERFDGVISTGFYLIIVKTIYHYGVMDGIVTLSCVMLWT